MAWLMNETIKTKSNPNFFFREGYFCFKIRKICEQDYFSWVIFSFRSSFFSSDYPAIE